MKFKNLQHPGVFISTTLALLYVVAVCFASMPGVAYAGTSEVEESTGVRFSYDISASMGSVSTSTGSSSYTEIALGLNAFFSDWLIWRNSGFTRMGQGYDGTYGLDTSARFVLNLGDAALGLNAFIGPGYRVILGQSSGTNQAGSSPFAEAGAVVRLGGLNLGGGVKSVFNSAVRSGEKDDVQYFLILSGGGML